MQLAVSSWISTSVVNEFITKNKIFLDQWSLRCSLVHTCVHENYFSMQEICFSVHEKKFESYTRYSWIAD